MEAALGVLYVDDPLPWIGVRGLKQLLSDIYGSVVDATGRTTTTLCGRQSLPPRRQYFFFFFFFLPKATPIYPNSIQALSRSTFVIYLITIIPREVTLITLRCPTFSYPS